MMSWLSALAVLVSATCLLLVTRRTSHVEADWVRNAVRQANPSSSQELDEELEDEPDLSLLEEIPPPLRPLCPKPPFTAAVYHHTCGSCRELWRQVGQAPDLGSLHMVHSQGEEHLLRRHGLLRQPAVALPDELMRQLPSGLAIRVESDWRVAELKLAISVDDLRQLFGNRTVPR